MTAFNGYPVSILFAVLFHALIISVVLYFEQAETETLDVIRPPSVKAILVNENPQQRNAEILQRREQQRQEERRAAERRAEQQRQEAAQAEAAAAQAAAREAELARQQEAQRRAAEQERARERAQEVQQRQEAEQLAAQQRRAQEVAARQEAERQRQAAEEQARRDAEARELAETEAEMVGAYLAIIHDLVQEQWSRPPSARNGMTVVLRLRLAPTGDILGNVEIVRSSGDFAFDRAAETAVLQVGRFSELQGMPPRMFERNFRSLLLTFRPEDLLN
ncbi:MAG: cell envelope integrity protein TolA [Pseudomonadales bacterium]|nr:cell envelope integrity protein TolA [Pseudomonadales bacterium]